MGWSILSARQVLFPQPSAAAPPQPVPTYTTHILQATDGHPFEVWRLDTPSPRARLLIFHGYHANRYQVLGIASGLRERGYESFLFELRGHGNRPGPCTFGLKEVEDARAVLEWMSRAATPRALPVGVLGLSMGAALACQVALRNAEVRAVVADSVYAHFFPIVAFSIKRRYRLPAFPWAWLTWWIVRLTVRGPRAALDPAAIASRMRQPLLAIHGGEDEVVPPSQGDLVYQRWGGPKERWFEPAAKHVEIVKRGQQAYCDRVASFFDRVLV